MSLYRSKIHPPRIVSLFFPIVTFALESKDKIMVNVIWLQKYNHSLSDQGVLVHELLHYTIGELKRRGFSLNSGSEEAYTYFLESVYKNALERLNKRTRK